MPQCATPGRLMAYLKPRNPQLDPRFEGIATQYMRFGEELGIRWDYAFYQMVVETGALSYWRGNRHGDVKPEQNNFAGLGASGGGERGESFRDIERRRPGPYRAHPDLCRAASRQPGRRAHPQGARVGHSHAWQQSFRRPITYSDLSTKWAPGNRTYVGMIEAVAERFHPLCRTPDPLPQLVRRRAR